MWACVAAACVGLMWGPPSLAAPPEASPASIERDLAVLDELDTVMLAADFDDVRLSTLVHDLAERLPVPVMLDEESLRSIGVREDDHVSLRTGHVPASTALDALMRELASGLDQPTWEVHGGAIVVTSESGTHAMRSLVIYDVRDLIGDDSLLGELRAARANIPDFGAGDGDANNDDGEERPRAEDDAPMANTSNLSAGHELLLIILEHLDPDAWVDMGGSRATITDHQGLVAVTAPTRLHRQFRDALRRLRAAQAGELRLGVHVIDLPRQTLIALEKKYQHEGELAVAMLREPAAVNIWQAVGTVATGAALELASDSDDRTVRVEVKAIYDRTAGALRMDVAAAMTLGADHREARTTVAFQFSEGAAILELPAALPSDTARLVIVRAM